MKTASYKPIQREIEMPDVEVAAEDYRQPVVA